MYNDIEFLACIEVKLVLRSSWNDKWVISPRYIGSTIKYLKAWNLFLACLYKSVGLFLKKRAYAI
ncbi:unnamed protein product, partial [Vitis vinifera]|uniref:Uncharacterized protein n=1 Tax=Vitis vinifera TaxID=29760 RepID=D7U8J4_VITVI